MPEPEPLGHACNGLIEIAIDLTLLEGLSARELSRILEGAKRPC